MQEKRGSGRACRGQIRAGAASGKTTQNHPKATWTPHPECPPESPSPGLGHGKRVVAGADRKDDVWTFNTKDLDTASLGQRVTAFGDSGHCVRRENHLSGRIGRDGHVE